MDAVNQKNIAAAMGRLRNAKPYLNRQELKTLRGQILAGDPEGAMKGLRRLLLLKGRGNH